MSAFVVFLQETVAASMTDLERKNLRRAMYSREAVRTEDDEEGEEKGERTASLQVTDCRKYFIYRA